MKPAPGEEPVWLVDASIWIFRAWFALPDTLLDEDGHEANAVQGWAGFLLGLLLEQRPRRIGVAFDESLETGFRHRLYPDYKANRVLPDAALARQLSQARRFAEVLGLSCAASDDFEADDLIACAAEQARTDGHPVRLVTRDKDLLQLLAPGDLWMDPTTPRSLDEAGAQERFGVVPAQIADLQALCGDSIDCIPGVPGIGVRSAAALLRHWGDLEAVLAAAAADRIGQTPGLRGAARIRQRLLEYRDDALLFRRLTRMEADLPAPWRPHADRFRLPGRGRVAEALAAVGLAGRLRRRVAGFPADADEEGID